ncbi:carbohydrate porin [Sphingobium sp. YR768]|uniref:carbohydrate porin n=1 Tax=Sphingobium sp. YR768 TaxID=1884365 RepID=UPI0008CCB26A|nr:carbohydrate porin [Sphingobium sp. YR768]SES02946.1 porin, OprB family [Sphingobium sp. YR768]
MAQIIHPLARLTVAGLLSLLPVAGAFAQDAAPAPDKTAAPPRETLTGDWGGLRTRLKQAGITVRADYVSETFSAVDGGQRRGTAYTQQLRGGFDFDMDRIAGLTGGTVHVTFNDRRGVGISSDFVGNRLPIQEAAGAYNTRLSELSYEQNLADGRLNLRLGFFAMGNDLGGMPLGCNFVNAAFCAHPLSESGNSGWYNYPNARWGAAVRYRLRPDLALRTGLYQVNPRLNDLDNGFRPFVGGTTGILLPLEVEYDPGVAPGSRVLPGHYKLGVYYDSSRAARRGEDGTLRGRYGFYALADQMILREGNAGRGLSIFGQFTANPAASAQITHWYAAGLVKIGTFSGRDADSISLGIVHAQVNPRLRRVAAEAQDLPGGYAALPMGETAIELSYGIQLRRWLSIRPDLQYILDPGAFSYRRTNDALALGGQVKMQF